MSSPTQRESTFDEAIEEHDDLKKAVDFVEHRFVAVERDPVTSDCFVKGFKTMRGACNAMARAVQEGEPFVPSFVLDLDTGERHEVDLFVQVVPKSVEAVQLVLPRPLAEAIHGHLFDTRLDGDREIEQAMTTIRQAIDRS